MVSGRQQLSSSFPSESVIQSLSALLRLRKIYDSEHNSIKEKVEEFIKMFRHSHSSEGLTLAVVEKGLSSGSDLIEDFNAVTLMNEMDRHGVERMRILNGIKSSSVTSLINFLSSDPHKSASNAIDDFNRDVKEINLLPRFYGWKTKGTENSTKAVKLAQFISDTSELRWALQELSLKAHEIYSSRGQEEINVIEGIFGLLAEVLEEKALLSLTADPHRFKGVMMQIITTLDESLVTSIVGQDQQSPREALIATVAQSLENSSLLLGEERGTLTERMKTVFSRKGKSSRAKPPLGSHVNLSIQSPLDIKSLLPEEFLPTMSEKEMKNIRKGFFSLVFDEKVLRHEFDEASSRREFFMMLVEKVNHAPHPAKRKQHLEILRKNIESLLLKDGGKGSSEKSPVTYSNIRLVWDVLDALEQSEDSVVQGFFHSIQESLRVIGPRSIFEGILPYLEERGAAQILEKSIAVFSDTSYSTLLNYIAGIWQDPPPAWMTEAIKVCCKTEKIERYVVELTTWPVGLVKALLNQFYQAEDTRRRLKVLELLTRHPSDEIRMDSLNGVSHSNRPEATYIMISLVRDPSRIVRRLAINLLGTRSGSEVIECLKSILSNRSWNRDFQDDQILALQALCRINDPEVNHYLSKFSSPKGYEKIFDPRWSVRKKAKDLLNRKNKEESSS